MSATPQTDVETCPACPHLLDGVHRDGQCRAWLTRNERCPCTHRAVLDARAEIDKTLGGEAA